MISKKNCKEHIFSFYAGLLTNINSLTISSHQKLTLSPNLRTGACCNDNGDHTFITNPGEYVFAKFTLESYSEVTFEKDPSTLKEINFAVLELHYGSKLTGESLDIAVNELVLHPGSTLTLQGGGHAAETGPGSGHMVSSGYNSAIIIIYYYIYIIIF